MVGNLFVVVASCVQMTPSLLSSVDFAIVGYSQGIHHSFQNQGTRLTSGAIEKVLCSSPLFFCFIILYSTIPGHGKDIYVSLRMGGPRAIKLKPRA